MGDVVTKDEAKQKWCPMVRITIDAAYSKVFTNRNIVKDDTVKKHTRCIADDCMAWKWTEYKDKFTGMATMVENGMIETKPSHERVGVKGYCTLLYGI